MLDRHLIAKTRPLAAAENVVRWKNYRVTVLQDRLFRVERSNERKFRDGATQSVWFRDMPPQKFDIYESENRFVVDTGVCKLILKTRREDCLVELDGKLWKIDNGGNLKGTYRTLDGWDGDLYVYPDGQRKIPLGTGVCSSTGVAVFDDASSLTLGEDGEVKPETGDGTDEYVFVYGKDYRAAVKALYLITGEVPLVPRYAFGNWWSRYHVYDEREYLALLNRFEEHDVPLTVATIDMDWHYSDSRKIDEEFSLTASGKDGEEYAAAGCYGWTGYSWNKHLFPDYRAFLDKISEKGLKITLNLHPADGVRFWEDCYEEMAEAMGIDPETKKRVKFDIADTRFVNYYFSLLHKPYEADGVTFWWIDWQQGTQSAIEGLDPLWALNHYHYLDHAKNHSAPLLLSRYAGIGSHRYPLGFSGDTYITWKTLKYLPYFTLTASNVGYTWWSHDIGGHQAGEMNGELYVRHVQFGVFSPINRLHCSNWVTMTKEPWIYGNGTGKIAEDWLRLRHSMIPFLYSCNYRTHKEGLALTEPLYYVWSGNREAYERKEEYLFGGQFIAAPVTEKMRSDGYARVKVWIPEGRWTDIFTGDSYLSPEGGETKTLLRSLDYIPVLAKAGAVLPLSLDKGNGAANPRALEIRCWSGDGSFTLYEDGTEEEKSGEFFTVFTMKNEISEGAGTQTLLISSSGDAGVLPEERKFFVRFADIPEGETTLYIDGERADTEEVIGDFATMKLNFLPGCEYRIEVKYRVRTRTEELIARAKDVLLRAEDDNEIKRLAWETIEKAETTEEYLSAVETSGVRKAVKLRLAEDVGAF